MEHITGADYIHAKRVCKDFEIKNLGILKLIHHFWVMLSKTSEKFV